MANKKKQEELQLQQAPPEFKLPAARQRLFEQISADIAAQQAGSSQYAEFNAASFNALCDRFKWSKIEDYKSSLAQFSTAHVGRYEFVSASGDSLTYRLVIPPTEQRLAAAQGFFDGDQITVFRNQMDVESPPAALSISVRKTTQSGLMFWVCTQTKVYGQQKYEKGRIYYKNFSLPYKVGKITILS